MLSKKQETKKEKRRGGFFSRLINKNKKKAKEDPKTSNLPEEMVNNITSAETREAKNSNVKTILLVGSTGKGKSALANVLVNKVNKNGQFENFQEIFKESEASVSVTREIQKKEFTEGNINYKIIDTVGIGDTRLKKEEVLDKLAEAVYLARNGISQIFFVIGIKFDEKEMANYNLLKAIIFDDKVVNHTTIIRTRFENFEDPKKCQEDIGLMVKEDDKNGELAKIIKSCQKRVVYVNNPSLNLVADDDEDEKEEKIRIEKEIRNRKEARSASRKKLIEHLKQVCEKESYQPPKLKKLSGEIIDYMESKMKLEEELKKLIIFADKSSQVVVSEEWLETPIKKNGPAVKKDLLENISELDNEDDKLSVGQRIACLEDKKVRLKKKIAKKERIVRQKVLKHIFNNYESISKELGGDALLNNVIEDNNDWGIIDRAFADRKLVLEWKSNEFSYHEVQEWAIGLGNKISFEQDSGFCAWLKDVKHLTVEKIKCLEYPQGIENLKREYVQWLEIDVNLHERYSRLQPQWIDIHPEFAEKYTSQTYREIWKESGITKKEAREWVAIGFSPCKKVSNIAYFCLPQDWRSQGLSLQDAKKWLEVGLETTEYDLANYLRRKNYNFSVVKGNLETLREEYKNWKKSLSAQEYLNFFYPLEERNETTRINIIKKNLVGSLIMTDFGKLKELDFGYNKLTYLDVSQNQKLTQLYCCHNQLTNNSLLLNKHGEKLTELHANHNHFTDLAPFSGLINCVKLYLHNNPFPNNNLKFLQGLKKLKELGIDSNQLNWKYLPATLEKIYCPGSLIEKLKVYQVEDSYLFGSYGFSYDYQTWRKDHLELVQQVEVPPKN